MYIIENWRKQAEYWCEYSASTNNATWRPRRHTNKKAIELIFRNARLAFRQSFNVQFNSQQSLNVPVPSPTDNLIHTEANYTGTSTTIPFYEQYAFIVSIKFSVYIQSKFSCVLYATLGMHQIVAICIHLKLQLIPRM